MPPPVPAPPFADWPGAHFDPLVGFFWFAHPGAFVSQSVATHGSLDVIERQNDLMDAVLKSRADEIRDAGGVLVFNDWRSVKSYDRDARARQRERMRARPSGYSRRTIIIVDPASRLLRMAIEAANLFATMTLGSKIEIALDAEASLRRAKLEPPRRGESFL